MAKKITPMMQQYNEIKSKYPDCILFFRLGDFYEMFGDDAVTGAKILDITLTSREKGEDALPMCGVPYHSAEGYVAKLTQKGYKVAICEQVSDPSDPGIVQREVIRVITPGTNINDIDGHSNQFVVGIADGKSGYAATFCDVSTGEMLVGRAATLADLRSLLAAYNPKELVAVAGLSEHPKIYEMAQNQGLTLSAHSLSQPKAKLKKHFEVKTLNAFGIEDDPIAIHSAALTLSYLESVLHTDLSNIKQLTLLASDDYFDLDQTTIFNLEIFHTIRDFDRRNSLLGVIDQTATAAGGRLLRRWVIRPLKNLKKLQERLDYVAQFRKMDVDRLRDELKVTYDVERLVSRLSLGYGNPRDLVQVKQTLTAIPRIKGLCVPKLSRGLPGLTTLLGRVEKAIKDDPPISRRDAGIFNDGYNKEIDELRLLLGEGKDFIASLKEQEIGATGIHNLKIGFNKVFGYFIEVSKGKVDMVPDHYIRKQTLTSSERYITPELKEYEEKVLSAEDKLKALEDSLFEKMIQDVLNYSEELMKLARQLALIDTLSSFAYLAKVNRYSKPVLADGSELKIVGGRHPVLEMIMPPGSFVPNNLQIDSKYFKLITGPNMGGKSTYLRQCAIIVLLAQIGSYVPADSARIGIVDQIYSRVGAADNLARGLSTFMVEMEETAYILRQATSQSLLILDEIGRGTSTYDGVSIAWSVVEHIHDKLKARTLFATHYHELIQVVDNLASAENLSVIVDEESGEPVFLHQIAKGAIDKSYGVHVAKLAGLPDEVVARSLQILTDLEKEIMAPGISKEIASKRDHQSLDDYDPPKLFVMDEAESELKSLLQEIDVESLTPLEALQELYRLRDSIS